MPGARTTVGPGAAAILLATLGMLLAGCARTARSPVPSSEASPVTTPDLAVSADARLFRVVPQESLVTILVRRGGTLARAGHNHVIASRDVAGTVAVAPDLERCAFELRMPAASLTVDDPELRRVLGDEFAADVPDGARAGTRTNLLGPAVLDAQRFPVVLVRSTKIEPGPGGALATLEITVRDVARRITVPLRYEQKADELLADGQMLIRQSDLGLTPFSALLGALQVQDEMTIGFRILARARPQAD